jgi:hypothetical protein
MFSLQPPRHIPTLPKRELACFELMSALASCGHAVAKARPVVPIGHIALPRPWERGVRYFRSAIRIELHARRD